MLKNIKKTDEINKKNWEEYYSAIKKQDWLAAKTILQKISQKEKNNPQVYLKMGDAYQRSGDTVNAITSYYTTAKILRFQGFHQKAIALYKIILRLDPDNSEVLYDSKKLLDEIKTIKSSPAVSLPSFVPTEIIPSHDKKPIVDIESPLSLPPEPPKEFTDNTKWLETTTYVSSEKLQEDMQELIVPLSEREQALTKPELFSNLSDEEYKNLLSAFDIKPFSNKEKVIEEGDSGDSLYIIKSGKTRVIAHILSKEIELAVLEEGDIFGEVAFLTGRPRTASVIAEGQLEVYEISRLNLEKIIENNPVILAKIEDFYETRVRNTIKKIKN